ncbi:Transcription elongation factor SPT5 [Frankliniella fusca]|uniref:Transcription elongation factor SPT5 n=1 Tax=Frankliniella fusca TaxID=407009 RepID=A0AAE1LIP4_9NEOP|nr:Transcription elongation factor SPT5 [Frankliniella fusca]
MNNLTEVFKLKHMDFITSTPATEAHRPHPGSILSSLTGKIMMIISLVLLSAAAVLAEPEAPVRRYAVANPSAPALAYLSAPLVVGSQRAAPAAALLALNAPAYPATQQYIARNYNGITTLALEQQQQQAYPLAAPLVAAPATPAAPTKYVVASAPAAPARFVVAEPEPTPCALLLHQLQLRVRRPRRPAAPAARIVEVSPASRVVAVAPQPAVAAAPAPAPAAVFAVAPEAVSSSSQYFSRNYNGVPQVTYFVVGPAPVTAPVAVAPQQGAVPARRPAPGTSPVPAGEPVNQGDVEVLDA